MPCGLGRKTVAQPVRTLRTRELESESPLVVIERAVSGQRQKEMSRLFDVGRDEIRLVPNGIDPEAFLLSSPQMTAMARIACGRSNVADG